jgi:ribosomal protein S18 acetylase RimI-like enzyme
MLSRYAIDEICDNEWSIAAKLIAQAIPNALISKLGNNFGSIFYRKIFEQECSCGYVARDESGNILGVIIGTANYPQSRSIAFKKQLGKLLIAANFRIFRWSVINWMISGIVENINAREESSANRPIAELIAIAVCNEERGTGLAQELVEEMEKFMVSKKIFGPYTILTENCNARANKFYAKIGAVLVKTFVHHGREINEWHKEITAAKEYE